MNEKELRNKVASIMLGWEGAARGDARHTEILSIYNGYKPLARGYTVQKNDAFCATTASAAYIKAGIAEYTGTECGVGQWVEIARKKGIWVENDAHTPKPGDAICYDWDDSGSGDNLGYPDHVGIVISVSGSSFVVLEGNINGGKVGRRNMQVNGRYIRGFICPDFAAIAAEISGTAPSSPTPKTITEIAMEVLENKWGSGDERKAALTAAGYDYDAVQAAVTAIVKAKNSPRTCTVTLPQLSKGCTGEAVKSLQALLISLGYTCGGKVVNGTEKPDGNFGSVTDAAVRKFQAAAKIGVDGLVGAITMSALWLRK